MQQDQHQHQHQQLPPLQVRRRARAPPCAVSRRAAATSHMLLHVAAAALTITLLLLSTYTRAACQADAGLAAPADVAATLAHLAAQGWACCRVHASSCSSFRYITTSSSGDAGHQVSARRHAGLLVQALCSCASAHGLTPAAATPPRLSLQEVQPAAAGSHGSVVVPVSTKASSLSMQLLLQLMDGVAAAPPAAASGGNSGAGAAEGMAGGGGCRCLSLAVVDGTVVSTVQLLEGLHPPPADG